jgi:hypothetical protein
MVERAVILGAARMPFNRFDRVLTSLSPPGLGGAEILRRRGGGRGLVAISPAGGQGDAVLAGV